VEKGSFQRTEVEADGLRLLVPKLTGTTEEGSFPPSRAGKKVEKGRSLELELLLSSKSRRTRLGEGSSLLLVQIETEVDGGSSLFLVSISWPTRMASSRCQFLGERGGPVR
jgi:hypothetical protein